MHDLWRWLIIVPGDPSVSSHLILTRGPDSKRSHDLIFANSSVLLFKDPQVCLAALLPAALAGLPRTSCQIITSPEHLYCDVGALLFGLCTLFVRKAV